MLIAISGVIAGVTTWYWLDRSRQILTELHDSTLLQARQSQELTRQSALFTTSAPLLLNLTSAYQTRTEGNRLLESIDRTAENWRDLQSVQTANQGDIPKVLETLAALRASLVSLMEDISAFSEGEDELRRSLSTLSSITRGLTSELDSAPTSGHSNMALYLHGIASLLVAAAHADSFIGLGEYRRQFLSLARSLANSPAPPQIADTLAHFDNLANGTAGLFDVRFRVLQHHIDARRTLGEVSQHAGTLNVLVVNTLQQAEVAVAKTRDQTTQGITLAIAVVVACAVFGLAMVTASATYLSNYVVKSLKRVTTAMSSLAAGDPSTTTPFRSSRQDEIGDLQSAFDVFRQNAIELRRTSQALSDNAALLSTVFENMQDGVALADADGRLVAQNPQFTPLLGRAGAVAALQPGDSVDDALHTLLSGTASNTAYRLDGNHTELVNKLGQSLEVRRSALPDNGHLWLLTDTTERKQVEQRLAQFQRLERLGQLTGEVAHDFNNVLTAIQASTASLTATASGTLSQAAIERIGDATEMGSALTQRLLAFAKRQQLTPQHTELNELVNGLGELIDLSLGDRVQLHTSTLDTPLVASIDPRQLESALLNLCINSANAIDGSGTVQIALSQTGPSTAAITVSDDGQGMTTDTLERAIEPFFSTNRGKCGSGLGLSIVYGFITQSGGEMHIASELGKGTTITLTIPLV